jgi:hypothetical protein
LLPPQTFSRKFKAEEFAIELIPMRPLSILLLLVGAFTCAGPAVGTEPPPRSYGEAAVVATIDTPGLIELSGLAASRVRDDTLWAHNDSLNKPTLFAVDSNGRDLGSVRLENASYLDWEDMASFELDGESYLVVGDIGDNRALRPFVSLWFVKEPSFQEGRIAANQNVRSEWAIHFHYEDGPRDCESLAIDERGKRILLLSKRSDPPALYELPLVGPSDESKVRMAHRIAEMPGIGRPSALDISPDGRRAAIQTHDSTYIYERADGQDWKDAFAATPQRIVTPRMASIEAVTFDRRGRSVFVTREERPNPLVRIDLAVD